MTRVLTVGENGGVTLDEDLLCHLGVGPGGQVQVDALPNGCIQITASRRTGHISDIFGMFKRPDGPSLTIDEMNEIIADGWAGKR